MTPWRKGSVGSLGWLVTFIILVIIVAAVIVFKNDGSFDFSDLRSWLPIALTIIMGLVMVIGHFVMNHNREFLFVSVQHEKAAKQFEKMLTANKRKFSNSKTVFKRVPWRAEKAVTFTIKKVKIHFVERTVGVDVVLETGVSEELRILILKALE